MIIDGNLASRGKEGNNSVTSSILRTGSQFLMMNGYRGWMAQGNHYSEHIIANGLKRMAVMFSALTRH